MAKKKDHSGPSGKQARKAISEYLKGERKKETGKLTNSARSKHAKKGK